MTKIGNPATPLSKDKGGPEKTTRHSGEVEGDAGAVVVGPLFALQPRAIIPSARDGRACPERPDAIGGAKEPLTVCLSGV